MELGRQAILHKKELHYLQDLMPPSVVKVLKSKRLRWAGLVDRMG
jgi:hypothetical protein